MLIAVIERESSGRADAVSENGKCIGLMQLSSKYFEGDLTDPENNIRQGATFLIELFDRYEDDFGLVLMKYHGEKNAVKKAKEGKVSKYAKTIMSRVEELIAEE